MATLSRGCGKYLIFGFIVEEITVYKDVSCESGCSLLVALQCTSTCIYSCI
jgi:hypothetical protein